MMQIQLFMLLADFDSEIAAELEAVLTLRPGLGNAVIILSFLLKLFVNSLLFPCISSF